jgi:glutathione peroxidase
MTLKQSLLKSFYPILMALGRRLDGKKDVLENTKGVKPGLSFYALKAMTSKGEETSFEMLKGKKVLLVNTASDCGYTAQYEELQKLHTQYKNELVILAFPSNDFKQQEKGTEKEIEEFCKTNYSVTFPLMLKSIVKKSPHQALVYTWLSDKTKNGWNDQAPQWNFAKYLVNEQGILTHYFAPSVSPLSKDVIKNL